MREEKKYIRDRANSILEVIMAYARLEFNVKTEISERGDVFDSLAAGVNMLGEELENSVVTIKEKEALLKEVHHRVKNNLQIISSLMNLQAASTTDPVFLELIRECRNRINSMAIIHEMLYQSKNLSSIQASDYIKHLVLSIESSFYSSAVHVDFFFDLDEDIFFEAERMIPLGLVLNEAISNSYKYAFTGGTGTVHIRLKQQQAGYFLSIRDNGIGLPENYDIQSSNSLGIQLIVTLAEQLEAELTWLRENGLGFEFRFV